MSMLLMVKAMQSKVGNPLRKLVLLKLADNANDQGECWPSYQYIADQCEMSKRSVMAHIDALILSGFLRKELRVGGEKGNKSNLYTLRIPSAGIATGVVQEIHHPSAGDSLPPSAGAAPRTSHSLEPVNEPNIDDSGESPTKNIQDVLFEKFWAVYRKQQSQGKAK
ncbi:MAG: helix-turn-helix domain-containing protein, partial [Candidatus Nanopelagicaceae bacterium]